MRRAIWPILGAAGLAFAILVALGSWQLARLHWKEDLIARVESRRGAAPAPLPDRSAWSRLKPEEYEYTHVTAAGLYGARDAQVFRSAGPNAPSGEGPGYLVMTPLQLEGGGTVLVNRGFVPLARVEEAKARPDGRVTVTGLMRAPEPRNAFTPNDQPDKGLWYTRDPASIAAALGLRDAAPFTIDLDPQPGAQGWPRPGATQVAFPNNHLSYALTWFGLAAALLGVTAVYVRRLRRG